MSFLRQIVDEINVVRTNPAVYAIKVQEYIPYFQGEILKLPNQRVAIKTYEGAAAFKECVNFLKSEKPTEAYIPSKGLTKIAKDFLIKGQNVDPSQFDTIDMNQIIDKYGSFFGTFSRVIDFGGSTPEQVVIFLLVNDGDKSRSQRDALLNPNLKNVGVSQGKHDIYGTITIIVFCTAFQEYYVETEEEEEQIKEISHRQFNSIKKDDLLSMEKDSFIKNKKIKVKTINIGKAGKLSILLSDWEKKFIEGLTIIGEMNGSDFKIIRNMATNNKLSFIDLSKTNIVSGGDYYYGKNSTKNNEFGIFLLNECIKLEKIVLPKAIVEIGLGAFSDCSNLTSLVIYSKVKSIKPIIWEGCIN